MRFSVITPTYNRPDFLSEALLSVQKQRGVAWEAVVVDDGDGSGVEVVRRLNDQRIRALQNPSRGQVDARNTGVEAAQGEVIVLLDDDDLFALPDYLHRVRILLEEGPTLVHSFGWLLDQESGHRRLWDLTATVESLQKDNTLLVAGLSYPRAFHDEIGPFDPGVGGYFDWDWHLRVTAAGYPLGVIDVPGVCYRSHAGSGSVQISSERRRHAFEALKRKHGLKVELKNHLLIFEEFRGRALEQR